ncbi:phosphoenolpyruvate synthase [Thiohalomonas denitrificans]|uniref:Phosphoenolpyruvate synthase n=1 Tax=Thiohalomonas denitrificans TaxID=415747 RepID=A0A1G5Q139_9GAMM|nr:phosphoenolpyruvate synthase [Thiohalomonas denitrificans]SCZ55564.1 phosphoenolpyruvate synthase [Thiohalomonas denitrificans]
MADENALTLPFSELRSTDTAIVGGKNASLGEMIASLKETGITVPDGFATTAHAYREFLRHNHLDGAIADVVGARNSDNLSESGKKIRHMFDKAKFPPRLEQEIREGYRQLGDGEEISVAVRSSATAEDLPAASFAGQQESFLNIRGEEALLDACRKCYASLFTARAISYRENQGFDHLEVALSIGIQHMVRSDLGGAGVMFSIDTETGFSEAVLINASWGLGELVVQGSVDPDEYRVFKPLLDQPQFRPVLERRLGNKSNKMIYAGGGDEPTRKIPTDESERNAFVLTDTEAMQLAQWAVIIERHYDRPMDIEWAKDGETGKLWVVQARPETVQSQRGTQMLKSYTLKNKGKELVRGLSVGDAIASGKVCQLASPDEIGQFEDGAILVTPMTDPDWVPVMKKAAAIVTDHGGRTSHAAIVSRELGVPAVVGTGNASSVLKSGQEVTVSCAEGDEGFIYEGTVDFEARDLALENVPETKTAVMLNLANPSAALQWWRLPADGVGLARMEFIINNLIKVHPMALVEPNRVADDSDRQKIAELTRAFDEPTDYFVETLARGISMIAASRWPNPVIVRMSDFKTNEYAELLGGRAFEPKEENPMLGWRGASRYYHEGYEKGFALECRAIKMAREELGLSNILVMIPFCRTLKEADRVLESMAGHGLVRGQSGLAIYVMCEIPSNVILAEQFAQRFDGFSIGSNDLTQLTLGVDRDSDRLSGLFDEQDEAVKVLISQVIERAHRHDCKVGLCGQAPSDHPEFARFLVESGIDSISVNPDSFIRVKEQVAATERGQQ